MCLTGLLKVPMLPMMLTKWMPLKITIDRPTERTFSNRYNIKIFATLIVCYPFSLFQDNHDRNIKVLFISLPDLNTQSHTASQTFNFILKLKVNSMFYLITWPRIQVPLTRWVCKWMRWPTIGWPKWKMEWWWRWLLTPTETPRSDQTSGCQCLRIKVNNIKQNSVCFYVAFLLGNASEKG